VPGACRGGVRSGIAAIDGRGSARGIARGLPEQSYTYSVGLGEPYLRMARVEIVCRDENVEALVQTIQTAGATGRPGDGYVFVTDLALAVRIRDGARGDGTLPR
jgi:nitrogen regulatory protein P-II 1